MHCCSLLTFSLYCAKTTPSVVAFTKTGERLVGEPAKRQAVTNAEKTISSIKRDMGTDRGRTIDGKKYSPQQISAMILQKLKADAESYLGEGYRGSYHSSAYFNECPSVRLPRMPVRSQVDVKRIINEPTAAALAYGLDNEKNRRSWYTTLVAVPLMYLSRSVTVSSKYWL